MKTPFDVLDILYAALSASELMTQLSGDVYKLSRPDDSDLEDVVINTLPMSGGQIQRLTANVNVYVPDLKTRIGPKNQSVANTLRMKELTELITPVLEERYRSNTGYYAFWLQNTHIIKEPESNQHYINFRVDFQFFPD